MISVEHGFLVQPRVPEDGRVVHPAGERRHGLGARDGRGGDRLVGRVLALREVEHHHVPVQARGDRAPDSARAAGDDERPLRARHRSRASTSATVGSAPNPVRHHVAPAWNHGAGSTSAGLVTMIGKGVAELLAHRVHVVRRLGLHGEVALPALRRAPRASCGASAHPPRRESGRSPAAAGTRRPSSARAGPVPRRASGRARACRPPRRTAPGRTHPSARTRSRRRAPAARRSGDPRTPSPARADGCGGAAAA